MAKIENTESKTTRTHFHTRLNISVNKSTYFAIRSCKNQLFNMPISCKICKIQDSEAMFTFPTKANNWRLVMKIPENQAVSSYRVCYRHFPMENVQAKITYSLKDKEGELIEREIS